MIACELNFGIADRRSHIGRGELALTEQFDVNLCIVSS